MSTKVIAVEEKGKWGVPRVDYNRGPKASFTTTLKYGMLMTILVNFIEPRNRRDGLEVTVDDLIAGFQRKGENRTRSLYAPIYPRWQQPRKEAKSLRVEFLVVSAVVGLVLIIIVVSLIYNWARKRCCKVKSRDFNFSMSMYDDDSDPGVVLRQSTEREKLGTTTLTRKPSLQDQVILRQSTESEDRKNALPRKSSFQGKISSDCNKNMEYARFSHY